MEKYFFSKKTVLISTAVILAAIIFSVYFFSRGSSAGNIQNADSASSSTRASLIIPANGKSLQLEIADTEAARGLGLSGRESLPENEAMFFIFDKPDFWGIWMKDMNFPIDILWLDGNYSVTDIVKSAAPDSYPEVFYPKTVSKYVVEMNAGEADRLGIKIGGNLKLFF